MKQTTALRRQTFVACGLSQKEAILYDILLSRGTAKAAELERESELKKNTYTILESLIKKNLVLKVQGQKVQVYQAATPSHLIGLVTQQEEAAKQSRATLDELLPALTSQYALNVGKPPVQYFEGENGLKQVFRDIYAPKPDVVYGCVDLEAADSVFPEHIVKELVPLRVKNKLAVHTLLGDSPKARELKLDDDTQFRKSVLLSKTDFPLPAEIDVYEDKVALLSFEKGKFIGMIIQNEAFAISLRSVFKKAFGGGS